MIGTSIMKDLIGWIWSKLTLKTLERCQWVTLLSCLFMLNRFSSSICCFWVSAATVAVAGQPAYLYCYSTCCCCVSRASPMHPSRCLHLDPARGLTAWPSLQVQWLPAVTRRGSPPIIISWNSPCCHHTLPNWYV